MHPHGQLTTVYTTEEGRVCKCTCCDLFQVPLGNALFSIHPNGMKDMVAFIDSMVAPGDEVTTDRKYMLRPDNRPYAFVFNYSELHELRQLLEGAQAMHTLKTMVESATGLPNTIY
ncbi:MAG: DUF6686 family protein [Bacteroidota bacterium]